MVKRLSKVTHGFVVQQFEEVGGVLTCVGQEFVAGDDVTWETPDGEVPDEVPDEAYQSFEMVQPVSGAGVCSVRGLLRALLGVGVDRLDDGVSVYCAGRGEYFPVDEVWFAAGSDVVDDGSVVLIVQD